MNGQLIKKIPSEIKIARARKLEPAMAYDRVSTTEQAEHGMSLEYQTNKARQYAELKGLYIIHTWSATESAFREGRKNFNEMLSMAEMFDIRHIIFKNTDRLGRNDIDWPRCKKLAREKGFHIHLYELNTIFGRRSTAEEEMFLDNTSSMAKYWSNKISQSVRNTFHWKASQGVSPGPSPYGYRYDSHLKRHVTDEKTGEIVRAIFSAADGKMSVQRIAAMLNEKGYRTGRGGKWGKTSVHRIIASPFYASKFEHQGEIYNGTHESYTTWGQYQERLKLLKTKFTGGKGETPFPLSAFLSNGETGRALTGEKKTGAHRSGEYIYYTHREPYFSLSQAQVLQLIDAEIEQIQYSKDLAEFITEVFRDSVSSEKKRKSSDMAKKTKKIAQLEIDNQRLLDLLIAGVDPRTVKTKMDDNRKAIELLENERQVDRLDEQKFIHEISDIIERIRQFPKIYRMGTPEEKAEGLRIMADHVKIYDDRAEIAWKKPFSFILNPAVISHFDGPAGRVRKNDDLGPGRNDLRTIILGISLAAQIYFTKVS